MKSLQCVVLILVLSLCGSQATSVRDESLNKYIDVVLDNVQTMMVEQGMDPAALPDAALGFNRTILGVTWFGKVGLTDGWLAGISTLERKGDAHFLLDAEGKVSGIDCKMGVATLKAHYKGVATFMDLGPKISVDATINGVDIWFNAELSKDVCKFKLAAFEIERIGFIKVDIHGLGYLNWILELVSGFVINLITVFIRELIENNLHRVINQALDEIDLSFIGFILGCDSQTAVHSPLDQIF